MRFGVHMAEPYHDRTLDHRPVNVGFAFSRNAS